MKKFEAEFRKLKAKKSIATSDYLVFAEVVLTRKFGRKTIQRWFKKLVDSDDCPPELRRPVLDYLYFIGTSLGSPYSGQNFVSKGRKNIEGKYDTRDKNNRLEQENRLMVFPPVEASFLVIN
ncbi:hypothetical protein KGQ34_03880 [Patescibacteria group bacterium]|nr:hypothetical protein [Patescibacteria group bacterium]